MTKPELEMLYTFLKENHYGGAIYESDYNFNTDELEKLTNQELSICRTLYSTDEAIYDACEREMIRRVMEKQQKAVATACS